MSRMPKYAKNRDLNESSIVATLRAAGADVLHLDAIDLLVGFRGTNYLLEVKQPGQKIRTEQQQKLHDSWRGQLAIVYTPTQALEAIGALKGANA